jgi:hypothetical protein
MDIIYPYRNRDIQRVKRSLDSLRKQSATNFKVHFVDYGSSNYFSRDIRALCSSYDFVHYRYCYTCYQPWNKSKALNNVIRELESGYCFVADVDMVFHRDFVKNAIGLQRGENSVYFQVGLLEPNEEPINEDFSSFRKSKSEATGLSMFPVKVLHELRGFDEFYHFWGAEDTDIHIRIRNAGYSVEFYEKEVLMLHLWHPSYRSKETPNLNNDLQISGIVQLNHQHLKFAEINKVTTVNNAKWGNIYSARQIKELQDVPVHFELSNERLQVDDFLFGQLPGMSNRIIKARISRNDAIQKTGKYKLKKLAGKKVPSFYTMKTVNDKILLHLISFYRNQPYIYRVEKNKNEIEFCIRL